MIFSEVWNDVEKFVTRHENEKLIYEEPEWCNRTHDERVAGIVQNEYFDVLYSQDYIDHDVVRRELVFNNKKKMLKKSMKVVMKF